MMYPSPARTRRARCGRHMTTTGLVLVLLLGTGTTSWAQSSSTPPADESTLAALSPSIRLAIQAVLDSAREATLPVAALNAKIAEGVSKRADDEQILRVVRDLASAMRRARAVLGVTSEPAELVAGAAALQAGAPDSTLQNIRVAVRGRPATEALVILADLLRRGVPSHDAASAVARLANAGASDGDLSLFRAEVARDLSHGRAAPAAMRARMQEFIARGANGVGQPPGAPRPQSIPPTL